MHTIDEIQITQYRIPLDPAFHASWDPQPRTSLTSTVVRVRSGDHEGVGSGDLMVGFAGNESLFLGEDVFAIRRHVHILDNLQFYYGRMWAFEVALWDLMGQIKEQPLWQMLGGHTPHVRVYASTGERRPAAVRAESARQLQALGFPALKVRFHDPDLRKDLAVVQAVRDAVGPEMAILVDANQGWHMPYDTFVPWDLKTALWMADALAELDVYWLEEPLHRHDFTGLSTLRQQAKIRIAGGEANREFAEWLQYLHFGSLDVYQPDVAWSTGVLRGCQLADACRSAGVVYSPHTWGDGLLLLANLHVSAAVSNAPFIEFPFDPPAWTIEKRDFILPHPIRPDDKGVVDLGHRPGLGVQLEWAALEPFRIK
jgi:L-alanine-DL-glutamate epimerase-like enolase superfamily enzyme